MNKEEFHTKLLERMPTVMFHSTTSDITKENFFEKVKIFNSVEEYNNYEAENDCYGYSEITGKKLIRRSFGRTNLDGGFHGFYLTPSFEKAKKWHNEESSPYKKIIEFYVNKEVILKHGCIVKGVPDEDWAWFIIQNRNKRLTRKNSFSFSYTVIADGTMNTLSDRIQQVRNQNDALDLWEDLFPNEYYDFYDDDNDKWQFERILASAKLAGGSTLQLSINSEEMLEKALIPIKEHRTL